MRPPVLPCDTDALFQAFLAKNLTPLQILKSAYGIQPVIVPEVEIELASNRKYGRRLAPQVKKALSNRTIVVLDEAAIQSLANLASPGASATLAAIQTLGSSYMQYVDFGEAYTHAAALTLATPCMSHDISALRALENAGLEVPESVLRYFDVVVLGCQAGHLSEHDCDEIRKALRAENEWLPKCFANCSFSQGVAAFYPRLRDGSKAPLGLAAPTVASAFAKQVIL